MSTQLILYPQFYNGFNSTSSTYNQFVVNGSFFTNLNATSLHSTTYIVAYVDAMYAQPPSILNTWYRFTTSGGATWGAVTAPQQALNNLVLSYNGTTLGHTGIYQQMSGLVVGADYDVVIDIDTAAVGILGVRIFEGASLTTTNVSYYSSNVSLITHTFTCVATNQTILIDYASTTAQLIIDSIKCTEGGQSPTQTYNDLQDGQVICDLYQEEDIPLTLSVDDFKNVAEKVQSYSKDFDLPATKRNNQIFDNVFEIIRTDTGLNFNPYVKTQCSLKQDGFILFEGYLRLIDIKDQEGEISYNVNLYSEAIALADILKERTLGDIDYLELQHDYTKFNIKVSWTTGVSYPNNNDSGYRDADTLKYPFVDWTGQILISDGTSGVAGYPQLVNLEQAFRPFIQLKYLINRIFQNTPFTWSSDLFDSADFGKLYMDFNWGSAEYGSVPDTVVGGPLHQIDSGSPDYFINPSGWKKLRFDTTYSGDNTLWDNTNYKFVSPTANLNVTVQYYINLDSVATVSTYANSLRIAKFDAGGNHLETFVQDDNSISPGGWKSIGAPANLFGFWAYSFSTTLNQNEYIQVQSATSTADKIKMSTTFGSQLRFQWDIDNVYTHSLLTSAREDVGQWDFLKGIMNMFNLISLSDPDNPNNIIFETYADTFITNTAGTNLAARSIQHDWTDKVDVSEMRLTPLTNLNKDTIFKFVEDEEDYPFKVYKTSTQHLYGSKEFEASTSSMGLETLLIGEKEIIAEPFGATVQKPLMPGGIFASFLVPSIYSMSDDGTTSGFHNSPRILYNNGVKDTGMTYYIPTQNGLSSENQSDYLQFSHLSDVPTIIGTRDFNFETHQLVQPVGNPVPDNLFNLYWLPYYNELYNADTRIMTLKVNLSPADINTFKFNDKVMIKNTVFRVNRIDYKPNDLATVEFILIP
jgi:hypothetical protein